MTESISGADESSNIKVEDVEVNPELSKVAVVGGIALKIVLAAGGLIIGSILGFILAISFGLVDFSC